MKHRQSKTPRVQALPQSADAADDESNAEGVSYGLVVKC